MHSQEMAASHPISAQGVFVIGPSPDCHSVFSNQHRPIAEFLAVVIAEKSHSNRQDTPIPPFARYTVHKPAAQGSVLELMVPPDRVTEHMRNEWIVVVQPDIVESRFSLGLVQL